MKKTLFIKISCFAKTLIISFILTACSFQQVIGMKIEFKDPFDKDCPTFLSYKDSDTDVVDFRHGKKPLVIWRCIYLRHFQTDKLENEIDGQLFSLRQEFGKPVFKGQFVMINDANLQSTLQQRIANPPYSEITIGKKRLEKFNDLFKFLQSLALHSYGAPNQPRNEDFSSKLKDVIVHATDATLSAYTIPLQERLQQAEANAIGLNEQKQKLQADLEATQKQMNEQSQKTTAEIAALGLRAGQLSPTRLRAEGAERDLAQEREQRQKNLADLEATRKQMGEQSQKSAEEFASVRFKLSPLRRKVDEQEAEIQELKRQLEETKKRPSYASTVRGNHQTKQ